MGIFTRFKDIMASNVNSLIAKSKNPEKTVMEYMNQLKADINAVSSDNAAMAVEKDRAARALNECEDEMAKYQRYADKASADGNSSDARLYLSKKEKLEPEYAKLKAKYDSIMEESDGLDAMYAKLTAELAECDERLGNIKNKMDQAEALNAATAAEMGNAKKKPLSADEAFGRMEDKANAVLDRAEAEAELNRISRPDSDIDDLTKKYE